MASHMQIYSINGENILPRISDTSTTMNNSTSIPSTTVPGSSSLFYAIFPALVAAVTISVNIFNLIILRHNNIVKESTRILLLSVSVADLTTGIMVIFYIYPGYTRQWTLGDQLCQILAFMMFLNIYVSVWTLLFLSLDRYFAITHPLRYQSIVSARRWYVIVALNWAFGAAMASPPLFGFGKYLFNPSERICGTSSLVSPLPTIIATLYFILALILAYVTSFLMIRAVWQRITANNMNSANFTITNQTSNLQRINTKASITIGFIVLGFSVTCLPGIIGNWVQAITRRPIPTGVEYTIWWMVISNSYLNFFIYCFTNKHYRKHLMWLLTCHCRNWTRKKCKENYRVIQQKLEAHKNERLAHEVPGQLGLRNGPYRSSWGPSESSQSNTSGLGQKNGRISRKRSCSESVLSSSYRLTSPDLCARPMSHDLSTRPMSHDISTRPMSHVDQRLKIEVSNL